MIKNMKTYKIIIVVLLLLSFVYIFKPQIIFLNFMNPGLTSMMKYRIKEAKKQGKEYTIHQKWIDYRKISPNLIRAVVIAEDEKFWEHSGFDFEGIKTALEYNLKKKKILRGGSTITQQLAKNLYLTPKRSLFRKLHEAVLAAELELFLSKKRIMELYLNVVEWGEGIFGCEMAARRYFSTSCSELNDDEALRLVSVLPNPRKYSPVRYSNFLSNRLDVLYQRYYRNTSSKIIK